MTELQIVITILILSASIWLARLLPFLIFKNTVKLPKIIEYLGRVLPPAMMGLLVIYCVKDFNFTDITALIPLLAAVAVVVVLHLIKRNTILSVIAGTAVYMILIKVL